MGVEILQGQPLHFDKQIFSDFRHGGLGNAHHDAGVAVGAGRTGDVDDSHHHQHFRKARKITGQNIVVDQGLQGVAAQSRCQGADENAHVKALKTYAYTIVKFVGSYIAALGGVDAIVFTAGIGENSPIIRKMVLERLAYLGIELDEENNNKRGDAVEVTKPGSQVKAFVIPTNEELMIAKDTVRLSH